MQEAEFGKISPRCISIAQSAIICFVKEPYDQNMRPFTILHYRNLLGESIGITFNASDHSALKSLLPQFDLGLLQQQRYPQSPQQITDISDRLEQLKDLKTQQLISDEEYALKKSQLLTML